MQYIANIPLHPPPCSCAAVTHLVSNLGVWPRGSFYTIPRAKTYTIMIFININQAKTRYKSVYSKCHNHK